MQEATVKKEGRKSANGGRHVHHGHELQRADCRGISASILMSNHIYKLRSSIYDTNCRLPRIVASSDKVPNRQL